jgi:hypothetical protein
LGDAADSSPVFEPVGDDCWGIRVYLSLTGGAQYSLNRNQLAKEKKNKKIQNNGRKKRKDETPTIRHS